MACRNRHPRDNCAQIPEIPQENTEKPGFAGQKHRKTRMARASPLASSRFIWNRKKTGLTQRSQKVYLIFNNNPMRVFDKMPAATDPVV
jgi:hypothetical protein